MTSSKRRSGSQRGRGIRHLLRSTSPRGEAGGLAQLVLLVIQVCAWLVPGARASSVPRGASPGAIIAQVSAIAHWALGVGALVVPLLVILAIARPLDSRGWRRLLAGVVAGTVLADLLGAAFRWRWLDGGALGGIPMEAVKSVGGPAVGVVPVLLMLSVLGLAWSVGLIPHLAAAGTRFGRWLEAVFSRLANALQDFPSAERDRPAGGGQRDDGSRVTIPERDGPGSRGPAEEEARPVPGGGEAPGKKPTPSPRPEKPPQADPPARRPVVGPGDGGGGARVTIPEIDQPVWGADPAQEGGAAPADHPAGSPSPVPAGHGPATPKPEGPPVAGAPQSPDGQPVAPEQVRPLVEEEVARLPGLARAERVVVTRKAIRVLAGLGPLTVGRIRSAVADALSEFRAVVDRAREDDAKVRNPRERVEDLVMVPGMDFDWIAGMQAVRERLEIAIAGALDPRKREAVEFVTGSAPRGGSILLYGAPGTGKSFFALAAAGDFSRRYGLRVVNASVGAVKGLHWSKQIARLGDIFALAQEISPCIVLWDEIDGLASDTRFTGRKYDSEKATEFKQQLDGVSSTGRLIVHIGTTNFPEQLELALVRDGRFLPIHVPPPDFEARCELIRMYMEEFRPEGEVDPEVLAAWSGSNTAAEIRGLFNDAAQRAIADNAGKPKEQWRRLRFEDFEAVKDRLGRRSFPAWLNRLRHEFSKPQNADRREYYKEIAELRRWEEPPPQGGQRPGPRGSSVS